MLKDIVVAWTPCAGWLIGAFLALWGVLRIAGGGFQFGRVRQIHRCESGSVQTLSFVLTLPVFIIVVMFIIQVSQLMIGIATVHYAAYASARSASVWLPATVTSVETSNTVAGGTLDRTGAQYPNWITLTQSGDNAHALGLEKLLRIWRAAAIACVPLSPSRRVTPSEPAGNTVSESLYQTYTALVPKTAGNTYMRTRIQRKTDYAQWNTLLVMTGRDADGITGPTYNPYPGHLVMDRDESTGQIYHRWVDWNSLEIGWEDPATCSVYFNFPMLPGPGRFLSEKLTGSNIPDRVSRHLKEMQKLNPNRYQKGLNVVILEAHATMQVEGLKSVIPHVQPR